MIKTIFVKRKLPFSLTMKGELAIDFIYYHDCLEFHVLIGNVKGTFNVS